MSPIGHIIIIILCSMTAVKCKQTSKGTKPCESTEFSKYEICKSSLNLIGCFQHNISQSQSFSRTQILNDIVDKLRNLSKENGVKYLGSSVFFLSPDTDFPGEEFSSCYNQFLANFTKLSKEMRANSVWRNPHYASTDESYRQKWKIMHKINFQYINHTLADIKTLRNAHSSNSIALKIFNLKNLHSCLEQYKKYLELSLQFHDVEMFQVITVNYIDPIIFTVIFLIGIGSNMSLLIIFIRNRQMCTAANVMFINLTIADLLFLVVHLIIYKMGFLLPLLTRKFSNDSQVCAYYFFILFTTGVAVYSVVVISVQRYCVLYTSKSIQKYNISFLLVGSVWIMAALLAIPDTEFALKTHTKLIQAFNLGNHIFQFIAYGVVPSFTIAVFYCAAARKVPKEIPGQCTTRDKIKRVRAKSVRILHSLTALFIVTYIPSLLLMLLLPLNPTKQTVRNLMMVYIAKCLMFLNSSCNPIMLYMGSEKFRKCFKQYILWFSKESSNGKIIYTDT